MRVAILYEDSELLVIDKKAGIVVNRAKTVKSETIQDWLDKKLKIPKTPVGPVDFYSRSGIVHRLDKETSGALLIAKTPSAFVNLQSQFRERKVSKKYLALVHGRVASRGGKIEVPIKRLSFKRERFGVVPNGRDAKTRFTTQAFFASTFGMFTLVQVEPETGRTHQIRVHLKYLGNPVVADPLYLGKRIYRQDKRWCPRLFLHAQEIGFNNPATGQKKVVFSPFPRDLKKALATLTVTVQTSDTPASKSNVIAIRLSLSGDPVEF